jgi:hypothetical protein
LGLQPGNGELLGEDGHLVVQGGELLHGGRRISEGNSRQKRKSHATQQ